jgi:predicted DNA-binding mobile mystery protein A
VTCYSGTYYRMLPCYKGTGRTFMNKRMSPPYRRLRLQQLSRSQTVFQAAKEEAPPQHGWLRAIREALGMSVAQVAQRIGVTRGRIFEFEKAEEEDRISLRSLKRVAEAMNCKLVYAIVPKTGTITELAEQRARDEASRRVLSVEHSMALENQASGNVKQLIEDETKRILNRK